MCLLILKPAKLSIPREYLISADIANPHGCGIAFPDGRTTKTLKGAKWGADDIERALSSIGDAPAIIHFRYATHGSLIDSNTHPFMLPRGIAAAHNGVISGVTCRDDESDTRAYLRQHVSPYVAKGQDITCPLFLDAVGAQVGAGNKLVFMDGKGRYGIANEKSGHWHGGSWYSNTSYQSYSFPWEAEEQDTDAEMAFWHEREVSELSCIDCGEHVGSMSFGKSVLIDPETGRIICGGCSREYLRRDSYSPRSFRDSMI